jgi:hypothetical protein
VPPLNVAHEYAVQCISMRADNALTSADPVEPKTIRKRSALDRRDLRGDHAARA